MRSSPCLLTVLAAMAAGSAPSPALAQGLPPWVQLTLGPDCGPSHASVPTIGEFSGSLVLQLDDFTVEASGDANPAPRTCSVHAAITLPPGMSLRPVAALADGEVSTSEHGAAEVDIAYSWGPDTDDTRTANQSFNAGVLAPFLLRTAEFEDTYWSPCPGDPRAPWPNTVINLDGTLQIRASRGPNDARASDISIFNSEAQGLRWIWEWGACGFNHKTFRSRYTTPAGAWVSGTTTLVGNHGTYTTDGGPGGTFTGVTYDDGGRTARGLWRFQDGSTGWFVFHLAADATSFEGTWGFGATPGHDQRGQWRGVDRPGGL